MKQVAVVCIMCLLILVSVSAGCTRAGNNPGATTAPTSVPTTVPPSPAATTASKCPAGYYWAVGDGGSGKCLQGFISGMVTKSSVRPGEPITVKGTCQGYPSVTADVYLMSGSSQVPVASKQATVGTGASYEMNIPTDGYTPGQYMITVRAAQNVQTKLSVTVTG